MENLQRYATPEVITVFGALLTAWIGWKACSKGVGLLGSIAQKASFLGLTAAILFITGIGSTGLGIGELVARATNSTPPATNQKGLSDDKLLTLADKVRDADMAKLLLEYARVRDGDVDTEDVRGLTRLIEKNLNSTDKEGNAKALTMYIEFLTARERNKKIGDLKNLVASNGNGFSFVSTTEPPANEPITKTPVLNRDSLFSIPLSLGLTGLGIGFAACGIACWKTRKSQTASGPTYR